MMAAASAATHTTVIPVFSRRPAPLPRRALVLGAQRGPDGDRGDDRDADADDDRDVDRLPEEVPLDDGGDHAATGSAGAAVALGPKLGCSETVSSGSTDCALLARQSRKPPIASAMQTDDRSRVAVGEELHHGVDEPAARRPRRAV